MAAGKITYAAPEFVQNLAPNLLESIGTYVKQGLSYRDERLYERKNLSFRSVVDATFPTLFVIDYNNIKRELQKYTNLESSISEFIGEEFASSNKNRAKKLTNAEIDLILDTIKSAESYLKGISTSINSKVLQEKVKSIATVGAENPNLVIKQFKNIFDKVLFLSDLSSSQASFYIFPTFDLLASNKGWSNALSNSLEGLIAVRGLNTDIDSVGKLLDYGHTAVGSTDAEGNITLSFNSPKIVSIIFDVMQSEGSVEAKAKKAMLATEDFINTSRQVEEYITITKDFSDSFVKIFVSFGGNIVKFENSVLNQLRGSTLEKNSPYGVNRATLNKLAQAFTSAGSKLGRLVLKGRSSPSLEEHITNVILKTIAGERVTSFKATTSRKSRNTVKEKVSTLSGIIKPGKKVVGIKPSSSSINFKAQGLPSLVKLQNLINMSLSQKIKENMGDGSRRDILNLQSGRFAESVKVTKMSQSREGMITAFYTYMRNPYQTFEPGFKQGSPGTRSPRLLISKSIRELASQQVANRMRAVLV